MKWKSYPAYEASGVEWLGRIPAHWEIVAVKRKYSVQLGKMLQNVPESITDVRVPYIKAMHIHWGEVDVSDLPTMWASPEEIRQYGISPGDLLVCEGGEAGRAGVVNSPPNVCIIQNAAHRVRGNGGDIRFLQYLLHEVSSSGWFDVLCNRATIAHFTGDKFAELRVPIPKALDEQHAIAAFLDRETERIDKLITKKERQIELLQEKRAALISHVVTKGLNPDVKMKESGVEWLGEIPEGWEIKAVWMLFKLGRGRVISHEEISNHPGEYPVYSSQTESDGVLGFIDNYDFVGDYLTWTTDGANAGTVFERHGKFSCTNVCGTLLAKEQQSNIGYFRHTINLATQWFVRHDINPKLMNNVMASIRVPVPSIEDQKSIMGLLETEIKHNFQLVEQIKNSLTKLREYRIALISAAVTGKIDVRQEVS